MKELVLALKGCFGWLLVLVGMLAFIYFGVIGMLLYIGGAPGTRVYSGQVAGIEYPNYDPGSNMRLLIMTNVMEEKDNGEIRKIDVKGSYTFPVQEVVSIELGQRIRTKCITAPYTIDTSKILQRITCHIISD